MNLRAVLAVIAGMVLNMTHAAHAGAAPDEKVVYKTAGDTNFQLHVFKPQDHKPDDRRPCIVFFFGGGWVQGSPSQFYEHCRYFAARGLVAISAEYRVKSRNGTTPYECVSDGKSAVRWIRRHAGELGVDPDRIAAGGGSAGGQVAAATAMLKTFDDPADDPNISAKPNALVLFNPVFDNGPDGFGYASVKDRWQEFSPLHNIAEGAPPTIVFLGSKDKLVPVATAQEYRNRMLKAGSRCYVWIYEGQEHAFFNYRSGGNPYYAATVFQADRFLASLGYLEGAPTLQDQPVKATVL